MVDRNELSPEDGASGGDGRSFGPRDLAELLSVTTGPAISIFLPREGSAPNGERDRLRFRAALDRAADLLGPEAQGDVERDLLEPLRPLAADAALWQRMGSALAVFRAAGFQRMYRLPADLPDLVVVGSTFHTRPLVRYLQSPDRFWILELGQGAVRLWRGDAAELRPVGGSPLPSDMDSALGYEYSREPQLVWRKAAGGRTGAIRSQTGGSVGAFSGHGVGEDDRSASLKRFFGVVDRALRDYLGPQPGPVILAAVGEHHPLFRSISQLQTLTPVGIEAAVHDWSPGRLHEAAWPIAVEVEEARIDSALALWEKSYGRGKGEMDLASLGRLAVAGRLHILLTERDRLLWGTMDRQSGELEVTREGGGDPGLETTELLDELSELVILHGGTTLVVPAERMPTSTGAAGILR